MLHKIYSENPLLNQACANLREAELLKLGRFAKTVFFSFSLKKNSL